MNETKEPSDQHIYSWLMFNNDTFKFFLKSVMFYRSLLEDDIKTIERDEDLSFLISDKEKRTFEIYEELNRVQRVENWFNRYFEKSGEDAWDFDVTSSHGNIRFLKSVGILFVEQLKKRRDSLVNKPRISKHALKAVDNKITYFTEKTEQGVFKTASPYPLFIDEIIMDAEETIQDNPESLVEVSKDKSRPTPRLIDSIDIFDPELKYRCLDLYQSFQEDGQTDR